MPRFFAQITEYPRAIIKGRDHVHHIARVLRMRAGDAISIREGEKGYRARIVKIEKDAVALEVFADEPLSDRTSVSISLALSLFDMKEWELALRMVTELGVHEVYPVVAVRSSVRGATEARLKRWRSIVLEAVKQCGRRTIPPVHGPMALDAFLGRVAPGWGARLVAHRETAVPLAPFHTPHVGILIGPEGGFTPKELDAIQDAGFTPVTMGRSTLRALTAAVSAVGILGQGDLGL